MSGTDIAVQESTHVHVNLMSQMSQVWLQREEMWLLRKKYHDKVSWKGEIPPEGEIPIKDYYLP